MSPLKKKTRAKRAARPRRKAAKRRPARGKLARRPASKRARKKTVAGPRRRAAKKAARKTSGRITRKAARTRATTATRTRRKPRLALVKRKPAPRPAPPAAAAPAAPAAPPFPQRANASSKQIVLFELVRARAAVLSAVQGLSGAATSEPLTAGKWSAREMLLHLVTRDQARLREMEAALRGVTPSWKGADDDRMHAINAELLEPLRRLDWDETLRLLHRTRQELMEAVESVPDEPAEPWSAEHPFGWMLHALPPHDRHHAEIIKRWRATRTV